MTKPDWHNPINTQRGSRAHVTEDSDLTVIPWRRHEIIVAAWVVLAFVALVSFTLGFWAGKP